ncbi:hypothetical protein EST38_g2684 [Candolleomyces aberdarensis]|uniref:F-box domain-containing protein n=1 Tax=Candolleomyces aberdarensis TaxID=2316362 RepID=A0A4Q2DSA9_9AGAR|nr:hypothetical protein EST38_g2684 [Candolleomyces aberdarensis]
MIPLSECAHLYSTNAIPNPKEAKALQREIEDLRSRIAELKSQLQGLEEELPQHEAVLFPVRRIPVKVLGKVFSLALPTTLDDKDREQLLNFCLVCKPWRDAALAAESLWSRVRVETCRNSFEKIVSWYNKSRDSPKSLEVAIELCNGEEDCADLGSECKSGNVVLAKLLTDGPILDHLYLNYQGSNCFWNLVEALHFYDTISKPKTRPWDCLRSLALGFDWDWEEPDDNSESTFHHIPSSVTSLSFRLPIADEMWKGNYISDVPLHVPSDVLQRLTCLTFTSDWTGDHGLQLLEHCQNVETLTLDILSKNPFGNPSNFTPSELTDSIVHLPQLRSLHLRRLLPVAVNMFLFLDTPNLVSLDIQLFPPEPEMTPEASSFAKTVLSFIERSGCQSTLRHLCIRDCPFTDEELAALLRGLSFITHLTLDDVPIKENGNVFHKLCFPTLALPHLQALELLELPPQFRFGDVQDFLQARRPGRFDNGVFVFEGPPDSLKKVIATYQKILAPGLSMKDRSDDTPYISALRRSGTLISVGPSEYHGRQVQYSA